jgi:hypothetical protein
MYHENWSHSEQRMLSVYEIQHKQTNKTRTPRFKWLHRYLCYTS